jgi:radical SAM superfamily enzyme YgiQ (UPF0313 family)
MTSESTRRLIDQRLGAEVGRIDKEAPTRVALVYPSPYNVAMSSLGYQVVYRTIQEMRGVACERAFLPDGADEPSGRVLERPITYEGRRELTEFPVLAVSVAYELELAGLVKLLDAASIPALTRDRNERHPLIVAGGPLTFSNPLPLAAFVDVIVMGEAEELVEPLLRALLEARDRAEALTLASKLHGVFVPALHGDAMPPPAACDNARLPAYSAIRTPHTELSNMFLIEAERGCSRGCTYCVMRRSTNGGMRIVPKEVILEKIPADVKKVGLVGAAVSDHPKIVELLHDLAARGISAGLSSLRPDRLKDELVGALKAVGYRTLTTALDGPSERMRGIIERRGREPHYQSAAELARKHGMDRLKLYLMVGIPSETDEDIDECVEFVTGLSRIIPVALGVAPFCSKRNTPLDRMPYAGVSVVQGRLERLRRGLKGRAEVRSVSAKWAWVEYVLAQGGVAEAEALLVAVRAGGRFADYRRAFADLGHMPDGRGYAEAVAPIAPERAKMRRLALVDAAAPTVK